jgi:hypothetical protein
MISFLQCVFLACVVVAIVALTDWRWALLLGGCAGFVTAVQAERRRTKKAG